MMFGDYIVFSSSLHDLSRLLKNFKVCCLVNNGKTECDSKHNCLNYIGSDPHFYSRNVLVGIFWTQERLLLVVWMLTSQIGLPNTSCDRLIRSWTTLEDLEVGHDTWQLLLLHHGIRRDCRFPRCTVDTTFLYLYRYEQFTPPHTNTSFAFTCRRIKASRHSTSPRSPRAHCQLVQI